jgi:hypothetical protein
MAKRKIKKTKAKWRKLPKGVVIALPPRRSGKSRALAEASHAYGADGHDKDPSWIGKAARKAKRAAAKVERDAYTFAPDDLLAIGIDYKNQRIMVKQVTGDPLPHDVMHKLDVQIRHAMTLGRMKRGWGLGRDCEHPRSRIKAKRYCVGTELGVMCFRMAKFCTCCGKILSHMDEKLTATVEEMIAAKVAYQQTHITGAAGPIVTRIRPMIDALKAKHNRRKA